MRDELLNRGGFRRGVVVTWFILAAAVLAAVPSPARSASADDEGGGTIMSSGIVTLERRSDLMRMTLTLTATGSDPRDALAKLDAKKKAVRAKLGDLGADDTNVKFGDAQLAQGGGDSSQRQQQLERMIMMRMRGGGGAAPAPTTGPAAAPSVTVSTTITAEWPLEGDSADALLVRSHELRAKVTAADLAGTATAKAAGAEMTEEEMEAAEEAEEAIEMSIGGDDGSMPPGQPMFVFVSRLSEEERAKATAEAFAKAKADAERLAKAAGATLGPLKDLSRQAGTNVDTNRYGYDYSDPFTSYFYNMVQRQQGGGGAEADEAIGMHPTGISYRVMVNASFRLVGAE